MLDVTVVYNTEVGIDRDTRVLVETFTLRSTGRGTDRLLVNLSLHEI